MIIIGLDTKVIFDNLPTSIGGYTVQSRDGQFYTIVLNARHSRQEQIESYHHECRHILNGDYEKKLSANLIEFYAHAK